ncbi:MAG: DUF2442 domain-containing protein [Anaerolineae bacterium]|nr:DUF2442 domain-containing protein [Anaerolineae bacterium]
MTQTEFQEQELYDVVGFEIISDYTIRVEFDDETEMVIDFEPILLGPLFRSLQDKSLFNQVQLNSDLGTLVWPNGADIDPTVLHNWPDHVEAITKRRQSLYSLSTES